MWAAGGLKGLEGAAKRRMLSLAAWAGAEEDMVAVCVWESKGSFGGFLGRAEGQSGPGSCMLSSGSREQAGAAMAGGRGWQERGRSLSGKKCSGLGVGARQARGEWKRSGGHREGN